MILLNLGCGQHAPDGWLNYDRSPTALLERLPAAKLSLRKLGLIGAEQMVAWPKNVIHVDLAAGLPHADQSVDGIYSSHALEHMYLADARELLRECARVLVPNGVLRLALPDADKLVRQRAAGEVTGLELNRRLGAHPESAPKGIRKIRALAGGSLHKWQPTRDLVEDLLADAGFTAISERRMFEGELPRLEEVEFRAESFFTEAKTVVVD